ncbi:MAG: CBS domain-containing protein [Planctomycetes bacterium]|nr:CBS domain-containing protein [Planctomycetota bacterium]
MSKTIKDVMQRGVVTCRVDANAVEIAVIMLDNDVSALVVIDESLNACGVVSKTDLIGSYGTDLSTVTAEDLMSPKIQTVSLDTPVHEAIQLMLQHRIHQLIIVTQARAHRRPVAIFTSGDVIALMAGKTRSRSEAQIHCSACLRKLISMDERKTTVHKTVG